MGKRKKIGAGVTIFLVIILILSSGGFAADNFEQKVSKGKLGIGVVIPSGITLKYWINQVNGIDLKAGWGSDEEKSRICLDYLWHRFDFFKRSKRQKLALYYGIGGKFHSGKHNDHISLRMVVGIDFIFIKVPFNFFLELSPTLQLSPETSLGIEPAVGLRYIFW